MAVQQNHWVYRSPFGFMISRMPVYFNHQTIKNEGDDKSGRFSIKSYREFDESYGAEAKIYVEWETIPKENYHHGKTSRNKISDFSTLEWVISGKEDKWHLSHDLTTFYGKRQKMEKRRVFVEYMIHGLVYCDYKQLFYNINCTVIEKYYENYKNLFLDVINSFACHE